MHADSRMRVGVLSLEPSFTDSLGGHFSDQGQDWPRVDKVLSEPTSLGFESLGLTERNIRKQRPGLRFLRPGFCKVEIKQGKGRKVAVVLTDFAFPYADLIPDEIRSKIKKWSDYVDYWTVDWNFQNDTFMQG